MSSPACLNCDPTRRTYPEHVIFQSRTNKQVLFSCFREYSKFFRFLETLKNYVKDVITCFLQKNLV